MNHTGGGLAQMAFPATNHFETGLGMPGSGFASRRSGSQVFTRRQSTAPPASIATVQGPTLSNNNNDGQSTGPGATPRTSRSHLLAGLRTAPKSPLPPNSAPPAQVPVQQHYTAQQHAAPRYGGNLSARQAPPQVPRTAVASAFGRDARMPTHNTGSNTASLYGLPEILAPPALTQEVEADFTGMDPTVYAELMANGQYLAQQQMLLKQQLHSLTMAQQQLQGLQLGNSMAAGSPYYQGSMAGQGFYQQQRQQGLQPVVTAVPGTPGLYTVYNPMTGQQSLMMDPHAQTASPQQFQQSQQQQQSLSSSVGSAGIVPELAHSPPPTTPTFHAQVSPPPESNAPIRTFRSPSPPKATTPPVEVTPLPPPSLTAFRRHVKQPSSLANAGAKVENALRSALPKTPGYPMTPQTGTFGPGQSRAGDHPIRQPRGPPSLEELVAKPTSKHDGSKNFVARQRRQRCQALNGLVRAGIERRGVSRGSNSIDSPGSGTPSSECEITFSVSSDTDNDSVAGGSSTSSVHGAIGSERKKMREPSRVNSLDGMMSKMPTASSPDGTRTAPLLVLTNAEQRKSTVF